MSLWNEPIPLARRRMSPTAPGREKTEERWGLLARGGPKERSFVILNCLKGRKGKSPGLIGACLDHGVNPSSFIVVGGGGVLKEKGGGGRGVRTGATGA